MIETYVPLYRKYRPQAFADVVGQQPIVQTLGNAITMNKVAHAYLFCGPRGTGKTSTARIFAKSLNCEQGPTLAPCQTCASCTGITHGNGIDVVEFDAASNGGVDDARELIENAQFTPMAGKFKIYIIDEVHMLSTAAFNALLKTLEEPPPSVVFIFATTEAHKVLPTIISRCQRFDFNRITTADIVARLADIAKTEKIGIADDALHVIARHARGGMRDAVGLLDQVGVLARAEKGKVISRHEVADFIGALEEDVLVSVGEAIARRDSGALLQQLADLSNRGVEPAQLVKELTGHFRNLLVVSACGTNMDATKLDLPVDYVEKLKKQQAEFSTEELPQILAKLAGIERNIRHTQQPLLWLEVGLIEIAYREDIFAVRELGERVKALEDQLAGGAPVAPRPQAAAPAVAPRPVARPQPAVSAPAASAPLAEEEPVSRPTAPVSTPAAKAPAPAVTNSLSGTYESICQKVASPPTKAMMGQQTFLVSADDNKVVIGCTSTAILEVLKKPEKFIHVRKAVEKHYGKEMAVDLILEKAPEKVPVAVGAPAKEVPNAKADEPELPPAPRKAATAVAEPTPKRATDLENPDLAEAKQHALDMLQGRVID